MDAPQRAIAWNAAAFYSASGAGQQELREKRDRWGVRIDDSGALAYDAAYFAAVFRNSGRGADCR